MLSKAVRKEAEPMAKLKKIIKTFLTFAKLTLIFTINEANLIKPSIYSYVSFK